MKKIAILTLYDSFNFGTFLQAYALSQFLAQQGYDIYFIENAKKNRFIKWVKNKDIKKMVFNIGQAYRYYKAQKYFRIKSPDETFDAIVIGSDEIWNIKNPSFSHHKRYFGYGLNAKKISKQLYDSGIQIPGFRSSKRQLYKILKKYIPALTIISGFFVGIIAFGADLTGALGGGTGVLLTVGIVHRLYEELAEEQLMSMNPVLRKVLGD